MTIAEALAQLPGPDGASFVSVFKHGSLVVEILAPPSLVPLPPHTRDEVYIVAQGTGELLNDGTRVSISPGDFLFVPAGVEHHFENFTDDLSYGSSSTALKAAKPMRRNKEASARYAG